MKSQWDCLRENLGEWHGSFTQFDPDGNELTDTPSVLILEEQPAEKTIRLVLRRWHNLPAGTSRDDVTPHEMIRSFAYPGPGYTVPFFETGTFSQGSLQWAPFGQFGAELALTCDNRRLRFVQLFEGTANGKSLLKSLTLIRETRAGQSESPSPPLTVNDLVGRWQGNGITLYPSGAEATEMATDMTVSVNGDILKQALAFGDRSTAQTIESTGHIDGNSILFEQSTTPYRALLLPGGGSAVYPTVIERDRSFLLEVGWLISPTQRQRLIRQYNQRGEWISLTLVQEYK